MTQMTSKKDTGTTLSRANGNKFLLAFVAILVGVILVAMHRASAAENDRGTPQPNNEMREQEYHRLSSASAGISEGYVSLPSRDQEPPVDLPYLRCGPRKRQHAVDGSTKDGGADASASDVAEELVLLHGAAFTKENWRSSGILAKICERSEGSLTAVALDLSVRADGLRLADAFDALVQGGVLSGDAAFFVSPSASGKAMVNLGELAASPSSVNGDSDGRTLLRRLVKGWIPVACFSVLSASESSIRVYPKSGIPILAVHGTEDARGKDSTKRLVDLAGATAVEMKGRHPCYLDSPDEFVGRVLKFAGVKTVSSK